ncbi:MAG: lipid A export permease/ATP-binding protein MsbA [Psychrobium sp.]|nr:lipid A export permease/ATP-binding protein MsbA [Psychrobium sp.]
MSSIKSAPQKSPSENTFETTLVAKRLLGYFKPFKIALFIASIALVIYALVDVSLIYMLKPLVDNGLGENGDRSTLALGAVIVLGIFFFRGIASFVSTFTLSWVGSNIIQRMRQQLFSKILGLPVSHFDKNSSGSLISKITYDAEQVSRALTQVIISIVREGVTIVATLGYMFYLSWQLSLVFFVVGPIIGLIISVVSKRFRTISKNIQNAMGQITVATEQMLKGHKIILAFGGQARENKRFAKINNHNRQQGMKLIGASASSTPFIQFIGSIAIALVLYIASLESVMEQISAGTFLALVGMMGSLMRPLKQLSRVNVEWQRGLTACSSVFELLDLQNEPDDGQQNFCASPSTDNSAGNSTDNKNGRASGAISINNLNFTYQGSEQAALKNINLEIKSGTKIALVGRSGSGKSTLANLLMRFYQHNSEDGGSIKLDDVAINDYQLASLRNQFALVSQQVVLFDDTISNNIAYGAINPPSEAQIYAAAKAAHVLEFSDKMSDGLDSQVGEDGASLSGGQRQRIAIARALLRDAPILILDEATSALDTESERSIQDALEVLQQNRTSIVVAHRLSTIENADVIIVMDNGEIIESGNHQQLLQLGGAYSQLHNMQQGQS